MSGSLVDDYELQHPEPGSAVIEYLIIILSSLPSLRPTTRLSSLVISTAHPVFLMLNKCINCSLFKVTEHEKLRLIL